MSGNTLKIIHGETRIQLFDSCLLAKLRLDDGASEAPCYHRYTISLRVARRVDFQMVKIKKNTSANLPMGKNQQQLI
jgi:hypothetical protein